MPDPVLSIIQQPPVFLNLAASIEKAVALIHEAADAKTGSGANIIVFPETWLPGYPVWLDGAPGAAIWDDAGAKALFRILYDNSVELGDAHLGAIQKACDETGSYVAQSGHEKRGGTLYNSMFFFSPGKDAPAPHRKLTPTYTEKLVWGVGDGSTLVNVETPYGGLGGLICWEHWVPLARAAMHELGEAIHIAQWPSVREMHQIASRQYAFEGRCFVAAAGTVLTKGDVLDGFDSLKISGGIDEPAARAMLEAIPGDNDEQLQFGGSGIIGPDGMWLAEPVTGKNATITATLPLAARTEELMSLDTAGHYARPDVFTLNVDTTARESVTFGAKAGDGED